MIHTINVMLHDENSPVQNGITFDTLLEEARDKLTMAAHTAMTEYLIYDYIIEEYDNNVSEQIVEQQETYASILKSMIEKSQKEGACINNGNEITQR